jgi:hypothetical protein
MLRPAMVSGSGTASLSTVLRVMAADASTPHTRQAKAQESVSESMIRIFLIVLAAGLVVLAAATVFLGENPPTPVTHPVERVLPNDKFQSH